MRSVKNAYEYDGEDVCTLRKEEQNYESRALGCGRIE